MSGGTVSFMFQDVTERTYATPQRAQKRLEEFVAGFQDDQHFRGLVVVNAQGRYVPCVVLNSKQQHYATLFAHNGIAVTF